MKTLVIDTSNKPLTVGIMDGFNLLAETTITTHQKHAEFLMPVIVDLVKKAELTPAGLDRIVVSNGPGSYTGIRMATTMAKTLAKTLAIELVTISSLQALALNVTNENYLINPIFDGRNHNMFTGLYEWQDGQLVNVIADRHTNLDEWQVELSNYATNKPIMILGQVADFADQLTAVLNERLLVAQGQVNVPRAAVIGEYATKLTPVTDVNAVVPNYLRLTKAEADWQKDHPGEELKTYVEKV